MKRIDMGLNTEPYWESADLAISRWLESGDREMVEYWENLRTKSLSLREQIVNAVES